MVSQKFPSKKPLSQRGSMLIVALEVLALLTIFAIAFATMMSLELQVSKSYGESIRANLIAQGGVEAGMVELQKRLKNADSLQDDWVFQKGDPNGLGCLVELEASSQPSFKKVVKGEIISGSMGSSYPGGKDYYLLKIWDHASRLNINGPQQSLTTMMENLGKAIAKYTSLANPIGGKSVQLIQLRDEYFGKRFSSLHQISQVLEPNKPQDVRTQILWNFISMEGWANPSTFHSNPSPTHISARIFKPGEPKSLLREHRYPVNINTCSKPVLYAVLAGLKGYRTIAKKVGKRTRRSFPVKFVKEEVALSDSTAEKLVEKICTYRQNQSFRTWEEFRDFLEAQRLDKILSYDEVSLVFVNASPNGFINKFSPPLARSFAHLDGRDFCLGVDKEDLIYSTTEFCFNSMGTFHIESLGVVENSSGYVIARAKVSADVKIFDILRLSSQRDFLSHKVNQQGFLTFPEPVRSIDGPGERFDGWLQLNPMVGPGKIAKQSFYLSFSKNSKADALWADVGRNGRPGGGKIANRTLGEGGDLTPEGVISWQNRLRGLHYNGDIKGEEGALEFWVKLLIPPDSGTNEVLACSSAEIKSKVLPVTVLIPPKQYYRDKSKGPWGITWRLERYGKELVSTRFFWGGIAPYKHVWTQATANIEQWQANEWHHIALTWTDVDQNFFVDGRPSIRKDLAPIENMRALNSKVKFNIFKLISNSPKDNLILGGYQHRLSKPGRIYNLGFKTMEKRFSNAVFDELRCYTSSKVFSATGFLPPSRYEVGFSNPPFYELALPLPSGAQLSFLSWTTWYPRQFQKGIDSIPLYKRREPLQISLSVKYKLGGSTWTALPPAKSAEYEGQGVSLNQTTTGGPLNIRLEIDNLAMVQPLNVTPVLDDITITYTTHPTILRLRKLP